MRGIILEGREGSANARHQTMITRRELSLYQPWLPCRVKTSFCSNCYVLENHDRFLFLTWEAKPYGLAEMGFICTFLGELGHLVV
jgi:hypothetical protein